MTDSKTQAGGVDDLLIRLQLQAKVADDCCSRYDVVAAILREAAALIAADARDAEKYRILRTIGICDGTMHLRITDEMDAAIDAARGEGDASDA